MKLKLSQPDDHIEKEADRVSEQIVSIYYNHSKTKSLSLLLTNRLLNYNAIGQ